MKTTLEIIALIAALIAVALLVDSLRSSRHDADQLNRTLATQKAALQQDQTRENQQNSQLAAALTAIAAQKRAVQTPQQAAQAIPQILPQLPLPISIELPSLSAEKPGETLPATISVPQADLKPLYDDLQDCRADALEDATTKKDLADEQARSSALARERDAAIAAAHGGSVAARVKRAAKWFAIGVIAGVATAAATHHPI